MKYLQPITVGIGIFGIAFSFGMHYQSTIQTCDILDIEQPVKEAYCEISATSPEIIYEQVPIYVEKECAITECDCTIDYDEGWNSCMRSYESVTSIKIPKRTEFKARNWKR